ncbi:hypothetical protein [Bacteroides ilei]|uniref:hypothetical protein n=1 Tax=Bacteroides ilei TaxID=1907658 RepID=UPI003AB35524
MKKLLLLPVVLCLANGCTEKPAETFTRSVMITTPVRSDAERIKHFFEVVRESHDISLGLEKPHNFDPFGHNMIDPSGPNSIDHLVLYSEIFFV